MHVEYFHDHARIEERLFDGPQLLQGGALCPDPAAPGMGLAVREDVATAYETAIAQPPSDGNQSAAAPRHS